MATLAELNIIFATKGLTQVKQGLSDVSTGIKRTSDETARARKNVNVFDTSLKDIQKTLRGVNADFRALQQASQFVATTIGGVLAASIAAANAQNKEFANAFREVRDAGQDLLASVGSQLTPIMKKLGVALREVGEKWKELPDAQKKSIVETAAFVLAVTAASAAISRLIRVFSGLFAVLLRHPFAVVLAGLTLLITKIEQATNKVGQFAKSVRQVMTLGNLVNFATNPVQGATQLAMQGGMAFGQKKTQEALGTVNLGDIHVKMKEQITPAQELIKQLKTEIDNVFTDLAVKMPTLAQTIASQLKFVFENLASGIGDSVGKAIVFGENFKDSFINILKNITAEVISSLTEIAVKKAALGFLGGGFGGIFGGIASGFGKILGLAEGGIVTRPTLAVVGEGSEPEAVVPLSKLDDMAGGGTTINFYGHTFLNDEASIDALVRKISGGQKRVTQRRTGGTQLTV